MSTWGMQYSLTSTEDTAAQRCRFVHEGQQQETARDNQPNHLLEENCLAIYLRLSNVMELVKTFSNVHYRFQKSPLQDCMWRDKNPVPYEANLNTFSLRTIPCVSVSSTVRSSPGVLYLPLSIEKYVAVNTLKK